MPTGRSGCRRQFRRVPNHGGSLPSVARWGSAGEREAPQLGGIGGVVGMLGRLYEWQLPLERQALAVAAELAAVEPGERLLDVATGTGGLPRELAARGARPREAVGLDRSASMLAVAAARLPPGWSLLLADAK